MTDQETDARAAARADAGRPNGGDPDRWMTDWDRSPRWPHYTRSKAGEVLPTPASPLGQTFSWEGGICLGWADGYVRVGSYSADEFDPVHSEACGFFGGY